MHLATVCERYLVPDRVAAAIANATSEDVGLITTANRTLAMTKTNLDEKDLNKENLLEEKKNVFFCENVDELYRDGRKDATLTTIQGDNEKSYQSNVLEEHYVLVGEPGTFYLSQISPVDGKVE